LQQLGLYDGKNVSVFSWGWNKHGQTGVGEEKGAYIMPRIVSDLSGVFIYSMAAGAYHSLAVMQNCLKLNSSKLPILREPFLSSLVFLCVLLA
jgi:Regulator of chromosome condensation (RCC1) repeat